jgi:hypothetical protein
MKMSKINILLFSALLMMISCGKPSDPESLDPGSAGYKIIKRFATSGYAQDLVKKDNLLYIAQGEGGLMIVDVTNPYHPLAVSTTSEDVRGYSNKIALKDSVVYLSAGSYGVTVLNTINPDEPVVTASNLSMKPAKNLYVYGEYLFTATSEQGVKIAKISYPTQPDIRGGVKTSGYAHDVKISSDTTLMLVACGEMGLSIFNISDFQEGYGNYPLVGWCDTPGYAETLVLLESESLAFLACGTSGLQIIDYSDLEDVHLVGSYDGAGYAKGLHYKNEKIYLTAETAGLQIIDVSNATNPKLLGSLASEYALNIAIDDDYIYLTDEVEGLIIVSIPK